MSQRAWVATRKGLFEWRRGATGWSIARTHFLAEPVSMVLPPADDGRMLAALNLGHFGVKLHASDDAGEHWTEVAAPAYPPQPEDASGPAWKLVQVWSLEAAHGTVWAGTLPGGLFRSADGGRSWQLVDALWSRPERLAWMGGGYDTPGIHSVCPHPQRAGEVLVGISCGGVWHTADDAASWQLRGNGLRADFMPPERAFDPNIQDVHRIVRCVAEPGVLWCQHHNGLWRSADNALSWQELQAEPSSFGFAAAAHPLDGNTAWFVPAKADQHRLPVDAAMSVSRTRDGGLTFQSLRNGLPQQQAYELVYRHGLAVSADGQSLLLGSTTGGLWASDDQGDHWHLLSHHLPPIHAIAFG
jgi:hypothetical protein